MHRKEVIITFARAAAGINAHPGEDASMEELQTLERQVIAFLENHNFTIERRVITAHHSVPRKDRRAKPAVIVRFINRKNKTDKFNSNYSN